jgi:hypothetical protein
MDIQCILSTNCLLVVATNFSIIILLKLISCGHKFAVTLNVLSRVKYGIFVCKTDLMLSHGTFRCLATTTEFTEQCPE